MDPLCHRLACVYTITRRLTPNLIFKHCIVNTVYCVIVKDPLRASAMSPDRVSTNSQIH